MSGSDSQQLRGEAAWRASVKEIAKRNDAARADCARRREAKLADAARDAARREHREARDLPRQPGR